MWLRQASLQAFCGPCSLWSVDIAVPGTQIVKLANLGTCRPLLRGTAVSVSVLDFDCTPNAAFQAVQCSNSAIIGCYRNVNQSAVKS